MVGGVWYIKVALGQIGGPICIKEYDTDGSIHFPHHCFDIILLPLLELIVCCKYLEHN